MLNNKKKKFGARKRVWGKWGVGYFIKD